MKTRLVPVAFALVLLSSVNLFAMDMKPDPMVRQLDYFAGSWTCTGVDFASEMGPEHKTQATVTAKWDMNGYWLNLRYSQMKTAGNPMPFTGNGFYGYDGSQKKLITVWADNAGGFSTETSSGWAGNRLEYTGPIHMGPMPATGRDTFVKMGPDKVMHTFDVEMKGTWKKLSEDTCTRKK
jgi:hypothetical protein